MGLLRRFETRKSLTCPQCGDVVADAVFRPFPGSLHVTANGGGPIRPHRGGWVLRRGYGIDEPAREYLTAHAPDLVFELDCGRGHRTVRAMPDLVRRIRGAKGGWVRL